MPYCVRGCHDDTFFFFHYAMHTLMLQFCQILM